MTDNLKKYLLFGGIGIVALLLSIWIFDKDGNGPFGRLSSDDYADKMSPLGNASAEACADYCVTMFSDLTRMVTMQNLFHDGGFSSMGMAPEILDK